MPFSLNKIMLIGNLGRDAETRFTTNNVSVSNFSLATTYSYKGKDGQWVNETTWHNIVSFNLSDYMKETLKKGKKLYVEGRLNKREFTDKDGNRRFSTEVVSERIIPLDSSSEGNGGGSSSVSSNGESESPVSEEDDLPF